MIINRTVLLPILAAFVLAMPTWSALPARPATAATFRSGDMVVVEADEVVEDDLYAAGKEVRIEGTIKGDLVVFAEQVRVTGTIEGDLMAAGQTVLVEGKIGENVRMAGQVLKLARGADVGGDLIGAGFSLECEPETVIHRDVVYGGYQLLLAGQVERDLLAGAAAIELRGRLGGDAKLNVGGSGDELPPSAFGPPPPVAFPSVRPGLTFGKDAQIDGRLDYTSPTESTIPETAQVTGGVHFDQQLPEASAQAPPPNPVWQGVRRFASLLIVGLLLVAFCSGWTTRVADHVRSKPLSSLGWGGVMLALALVVLVILLVVTLVTAVLVGMLTLSDLVPVVIVLGMLGMASLLGLSWVYVSYVAQVVIALMLGRLVFRQGSATSLPGRVAALVLGLVLIVAAGFIPVAGFLIGLAVVLLGLGGLWHWWNARSSAVPTAADVTAGKPAMA